MTLEEFVAETSSVRELMRRRTPEAYREAGQRLDRLLLISPFHPDLLLMRGHVAELSEGDLSLDDAKRLFAVAQAACPSYTEPLIELGHYVYVFDNDHTRAASLFDRARRLSLAQLVSAIEGSIKVALDDGKRPWAEECFLWLKTLAATFDDAGIDARVLDLQISRDLD